MDLLAVLLRTEKEFGDDHVFDLGRVVLKFCCLCCIDVREHADTWARRVEEVMTNLETIFADFFFSPIMQIMIQI